MSAPSSEGTRTLPSSCVHHRFSGARIVFGSGAGTDVISIRVSSISTSG